MGWPPLPFSWRLKISTLIVFIYGINFFLKMLFVVSRISTRLVILFIGVVSRFVKRFKEIKIHKNNFKTGWRHCLVSSLSSTNFGNNGKKLGKSPYHRFLSSQFLPSILFSFVGEKPSTNFPAGTFFHLL